MRDEPPFVRGSTTLSAANFLLGFVPLEMRTPGTLIPVSIHTNRFNELMFAVWRCDGAGRP